MEEFELIQKVRAGEIEAFEKWMDIYSSDMERFAVQYGCSLKQAGEVAEGTFRNLHNQLGSFDNEESLVCAVYKNALNSLAHVQQANPANETVVPFEEDQELHNQIVQLETVIKVPFILSKFHKLDNLEIVTITDTSPEAIEQAIMKASRALGEARLEKRLKFLNKSYGRMKSSFRKEQVLATPQKEVQVTGKLKQSISKKTMISWVTGILVLLVLVAVPVVTGEEYKKASAEKYMERLKESFEKEMGTRFTELGLTESTEEEKVEFSFIMYGNQAREDFEAMTRRYERVIAETGILNKKKIREEYKEIIKTLELPSEMAKRLVKNPLTNDKVNSEEFMKSYLKQYDILQQPYYMIFLKHEQLIRNAIDDEGRDVEKFMKEKDSYPEDLKNALDGMIKQNIYPTFIKNWGSIIPSYGKNDFSTKIRSLIHEDFGGFFTILESAPFVSYPGLAHSLEDSVGFLMETEKTLLATTMDYEKDGMSSWTCSELFFEIVGGAETHRIFGTDGKVKKEYQAAWKRIASVGEGSPTAFIMKMIISEMEETDWTESGSLNRLEVYDVHQALELAKAGKLETFGISGIMQTETGMEIVRLPNPTFENIVQETYYSFSSNHDISVLKEVSPLIIIGVYFYADDQEDPETMWHLYSKTKNVVTLEEFVDEWSHLDVDIYSLDSLQFDGSEETAGSIGFERGNSISFGTRMALNEDFIWEIEHLILSPTLFE